MSRPPVTKKEDIISVAMALFRKNGVDGTTVSDIVKAAHIAQGTFYNYFQSKDEVFAAVLEKATEYSLKEMRKTADRKDIGPVKKLRLLTQQDFELNRRNDSLFDALHESRYAYAHQKYIVGRIQKLKPVYAELIRQSVGAGSCDTPYPEEAALFLLTAQKFVFDPAFFTFSGEEMPKMAEAVSNFAERVLGAEHDSAEQEKWKQNMLHYFGGGTK